MENGLDRNLAKILAYDVAYQGKYCSKHSLAIYDACIYWYLRSIYSILFHMFENRTLVDLLRFNQVVQAQTKHSLRDPVRPAGVPDQPNGNFLNTNTCSIDAAQAHLCPHVLEFVRLPDLLISYRTYVGLNRDSSSSLDVLFHKLM